MRLLSLCFSKKINKVTPALRAYTEEQWFFMTVRLSIDPNMPCKFMYPTI